MGVPDFMYDAGSSTSIAEKFSNGLSRMDIDEIIDFESSDLDDERNPSREVSTAFFEHYGLISQQINSYNDFVNHGIQRVFDSIGDIVIEPGYDSSEKAEEDWRRASLKFGKVKLEPPTLYTGENFSSSNEGAKEFLEMYPRHARLQNMTYASKIIVEVHLEVYTMSASRSDKFKTGVDEFIEKKSLNDYRSDVQIGSLPVMVKSNLCRTSQLVEQKDCEYEQGGYFIVKGAEKTFIAQEQICLKRLWVAKDPAWTVSYRPVSKRERVCIKLVRKQENVIGGEKILTVYFAGVEIPIWIMFFALGVPNDKELVQLIDLDSDIINMLLVSIYDADKKCNAFREKEVAHKHIKELMKQCRFPPAESIEDCIKNFLFPNLQTTTQKARFLAYMTKCLLEAFKGRRKVDNRDEFRNKSLELAGELLEGELRVHIKHAERRMTKAIQRDLYRDREVQSIEHYMDASIITNGLSRAFSTVAWSHPYKKMKRTSGVVATIRRTNVLQAVAGMTKTRQQVSYTGRACYERSFLSVAPLNLDVQDLAEANLWLFPILQQYTAGAKLQFFVDIILPMIETMGPKLNHDEDAHLAPVMKALQIFIRRNKKTLEELAITSYSSDVSSVNLDVMRSAGRELLTLISQVHFTYTSWVFQKLFRMLDELWSFTTIVGFMKDNHVTLGADSQVMTRTGQVRHSNFLKVRKVIRTGLFMAGSGKVQTFRDFTRRIRERFDSVSRRPRRVGIVAEFIEDMMSSPLVIAPYTILLAGRVKNRKLVLVRIQKHLDGEIVIMSGRKFYASGTGAEFVIPPTTDDILNTDIMVDMANVSYMIENAGREGNDPKTGGLALTTCIDNAGYVHKLVREPTTTPAGYQTRVFQRKLIREDSDLPDIFVV